MTQTTEFLVFGRGISVFSMHMRMGGGGSITGKHSNLSQLYNTQTSSELHLASSLKRVGSEEAGALS
jgi:hypothetical protein